MMAIMTPTLRFSDVPALGNQSLLEGALDLIADSIVSGGDHAGVDWSVPAEAVHRLSTEGEHGQAGALALAALKHHMTDVDLLKSARSAFTRLGAVSLSAAATSALGTIAPTPDVTRQLDELLGRIEETSLDWRPAVAAPSEHLLPFSDKRVLHILKLSLPQRQSGYTVRSRYILEAQRRVGLDPFAVTALGFAASADAEGTRAPEDVNGIPHFRLDLGADTPAPSARDYLAAYASAAAEVVKAVRPAVIHAHSGHRGYESALVALALGRAFDLPVVYEVRGFFEATWTSDVRWAERGELFERRTRTEESCFGEAAAVVTLSEGMRAEIHARGVPAEKIFIVPNGVDMDAFAPAPRNKALAEQLGTDSAFTFGYVSNLDHPREGHELLIKAVVRLAQEGIESRCLIVGDGKRRDLLESLARSAGVEDQVIFTGKVPHEEVLDYYGLLDAFVIPRMPERAARLVTPLKPFEAMALGIPVVVSGLEALNEIIGHGSRGYAFTPTDVSSLAAVLAKIANGPEESRALAANARTWVGAERNWFSYGDLYSTIYREAIRAHQGAQMTAELHPRT